MQTAGTGRRHAGSADGRGSNYWYEGKPAVVNTRGPYGNLMEKKGEVRDGGSLWEREGRIAVWNTVMDEDRYMTRRWIEFISG
jgi:putative spermidine/putrescine transport system substrate-binding protein